MYGDPAVRRQRRLRNARRRVVGWIVAPLAWLLPRLPLALLRGIVRPLFGSALALVHGRFASASAARALGIGPDEARGIARRSCFHLAEQLAESAWATRHVESVFDGRLDDADARAKVAAFEREWGKGWIGITGHLGNWELLALWLRRTVASGRVTVIAKRSPNPHLNRIIERMRRRLGLDTLYQDESPARAVEVLRSGGVVGIVPDQDVKSISGMFVEFFGREAYTPVGPARLAVAARVPIVCGFLVSAGTGYRMIANDPIWPDPSLPRSAQIEAMTLAWSRQVEDAIRTWPTQWPWLHDRWKTTPAKLAARGRRSLEVG